MSNECRRAENVCRAVCWRTHGHVANILLRHARTQTQSIIFRTCPGKISGMKTVHSVFVIISRGIFGHRGEGYFIFRIFFDK